MKPIEIAVPPVLSRSGIDSLRSALERAFVAETGGVVILVGNPQAFCKGMDLSADFGPGFEDHVRQFAACLELIRLGPKPVVAAVAGPATAGGVGLAAAADIVIASPSATFSLTELLFGLLPAVILPYLLERLAKARVRSWALSSATLSAEEAETAGLVDVLSETADLGPCLKSWTRRLSRTQAVGLWKRYTAECGGLEPHRGATVTISRMRDPQVLENIRRFNENEELPWMNAR